MNHSAFSTAFAAHAAYLAGIVERLREAANAILATAQAQEDAETSSKVCTLVRSIEQEGAAIASLQPALVAAPKPDPGAANIEPHDEVEEASMESFPASDPPARRDHSR